MKFLQNRLSESLLCSFLVIYSTSAYGQIIPDNTLGSENSRVIPNLQINGINLDIVNGGAERGVNLFHSFNDFNISNGQRVYFVNPSGVQNILTRVTGGNASNILGTLGVAGTANFYLINPNGILFGSNASLDVQGSFVATTANSIKFDTQGLFSTTKPEAPGLLTVNPSALLFSQIQGNASITNLSEAPAGVNLLGQSITGLRVADSKSLLLVGGDININSGSLRAYGGNIELAGIATTAEVGLNIAGENISLNIPQNIQRGDVALSNGAEINVRGANNGNIIIHAANINLINESKLRAGIDNSLGTSNSQAGDITINATGQVNLTNNSFIANIISEGSSGKSGDVKINTGSLNLDTSQINVSTSGQSNAGNIFVQAKDNIFFTNSAVFSVVNRTAVGNGGNILVEGGSVFLAQNSTLEANTFGQGSAGNITVNARDGIRLTDISDISNSVREQGTGQAGKIQIQSSSLALENFSFIDNSMGEQALGTGGGILIDTGSLTMTGGAQLTGLTSGNGNIGNITIKANDITFKDSPRSNNSGIFAPSGILTRVEKQATGSIGDISIQANTFFISDNASIVISTRGQGNAGNIFIQTDRLELTRSLIALNTSVEDGASGRGGNIQLHTGVLSFSESAGIDSSTVGTGDAGAIIIDTDSLIMERPASTPFESVFNETQIVLSGKINANTALSGKGGDVTINARDNIYIDNGSISSSVLDGGSRFPGFRGTGNGGNISITTGSLQLVNNTYIDTQVTGQASAGNISIKARDTVSLDNRSLISSSLLTPGFNNTVSRGQAGNINIDARSLFLTNGSLLSASTGAEGNAGQIQVNTTDQVIINSNNNIRSGFLSSLLSGSTGKSGGIQINTGSLLVDSQGYIVAATEGNGDAGNITINARDSISFTNSSLLSTNTLGQGNAGDITLTGGSILLQKGGQINTSTFGRGNAGNISINTRNAINFDGVGENGLASGTYSTVNNNAIGKGGDIKITGQTLSINRGGVISSSFGQGTAGDIDINFATVRLDNASAIAATTNSGNGGNINLTANDFLLLRRGSLISTTAGNAFSGGDGGNITIDTPFIVAVPNENSDITANAFTGSGGKINLTVQTIFGIEPRRTGGVTPKSDITASSQFGTQGEINIIQPEIQPIQQLAELPEQLVDASNQIGQMCPRGANFAKPLGEFTITGRGSLPPSPLETLPGTTTTTTFVEVAPTSTSTSFSQPTSTTPPQLIEAQTWVKGADGNITLVTMVPNSPTHIFTNSCF
ncbi:MAG: filamentous hemagglutinin N-terminal domain-containing protein [Calothrix sp. C42_A2020_038]|nr:filamentous hemagglutinin N-terminal domain-containing protein [Calothrix sp. C42_A2020_038]